MIRSNQPLTRKYFFRSTNYAFETNIFYLFTDLSFDTTSRSRETLGLAREI